MFYWDRIPDIERWFFHRIWRCTHVVQFVFLQVIFCTGIAYFLQMLAQKYTKSTHTAIILSLGVVFGSGELKESSSEVIKI